MWRSRLVDKLSNPSSRIGALPWRARIAGIILVLLVLVAILAPVLQPYAPNVLHVGPNLAGPSADYLMGTDHFGRDLLSRVMGGAQISMTIGIISVILALVMAAVIGSVAAVSRRWINESVMRVLDVVMAFPAVIIAVCTASIVRPGVATTIGVIAVIYTPPLARVVRANVLAQYSESYVDAARSAGSGRPRILLRHVAVNCAAPVLVFAATMVADAIVLEASLSFLGLGIQPPAPSWGNILADGRAQLFAGAWWICFFPGLAIFATVLSLNVLAEGFADALAAPKRATEETSAATSVPVTRDRDDLLTADDRGDVLRVERLTIAFPEIYGTTPVVSDVSFDVGKGEIVSMVGESGCGKSLVGLALMGLAPPGATITGRAMLGDRDLLAMSTRERRGVLGSRVAMIYQDALSALNPGMTAGKQLAQVCSLGATRTPAELLDLVGLPSTTLKSYPNQLSGGQRQRVLIAMGLARSPELLIADEPTTALDETIQAQVIELLIDLQKELRFSIVLVTHDLALANGIADRVLVMYAGQLIEAGPIRQVASAPRHPYSAGLLGAISSLEDRSGRLLPIAGTVPPPTQFPTGCRFADRCDRAQDICTQQTPSMVEFSSRRYDACHFPLDTSVGTSTSDSKVVTRS